MPYKINNASQRYTHSKPRGAIRRSRKDGDKIWKKSLSGETTRTCHKNNAIKSDYVDEKELLHFLYVNHSLYPATALWVYSKFITCLLSHLSIANSRLHNHDCMKVFGS